MADNKNVYKDSLNLPQTDFPIRAGLSTKEPELLSHWTAIGLSDQLNEQANSYSESYILHDGPPYPNGNIHMGHALNKILKDVVVRSKHMAGFRSPYVPGWDCHGLPIETQVIKELKKSGNSDKKQDIAWFRKRCEDFARQYVDTQRSDFKRLGILGDWDNPYLTLDPSYEAGVVRRFAELAENGLVFRGKKPIHWCPSCETALAEAEIEYADHKSPSITIRFNVKTPSSDLEKWADKPLSIWVWTTTPWTLPANVAIAAHPKFTYVVAESNQERFIVVEPLLEQLTEALGLENVQVLDKLSGNALSGTKTQHPFIDRSSDVVLADYVSDEDGTGFVHIAPGHGQDDYLVGKTYDLPTLMPVDDKGKFTKDVEWEGLFVFDANKPITERLESNGNLVNLRFIKHSYPHCWRCKNPVIFRATKQWFIALDSPMNSNSQTLREAALSALKSVKFYPEWGQNRLYSMIENRPDWCVSRQRSWGIPIPAFICTNCDQAELGGEFSDAIVSLIKTHGTSAWFTQSAEEILPEHLVCTQCGEASFEKAKDILDVWFESGASFGSVLETRSELKFPASLYLEGSDQHRGWFHSALLIGVGTRQRAPYEAILTHGFLVDEKGRKMSKSMGNVIAPQKVIQQYGSDILRWWIVGTDFKNDINISENVLKQARDTFSKVRNTIRFLLSNLYDFDPNTHAVPVQDLTDLDQWALHKAYHMIQSVRDAYDKFEFHIVTHTIHDFCAVNLSNLYLDMVKDRLYCDATDSHRRRSAQTTFHLILDKLLPLLAPILVFTAEDAYHYFNKPNKQPSVHLEPLADAPPSWRQGKIEHLFKSLFDIREAVYQKLEPLRATKEIGSFLEGQVTLSLPEQYEFKDWDSFLIVSDIQIQDGPSLGIDVKKTEQARCERCWRHVPVKNALCNRCETVVATNNA